MRSPGVDRATGTTGRLKLENTSRDEEPKLPKLGNERKNIPPRSPNKSPNKESGSTSSSAVVVVVSVVVVEDVDVVVVVVVDAVF